MTKRAASRAIALTLFFLTAPCGPVAASSDFNDEVQTATQTAQATEAQRTQLLVEAKVAEATVLLLNAFPEKTRTAAQTFVLGNTLFEIDRAASYRLHKRAAELAPNEPMVTFEWAMEQHRAGEFAVALASYQKFSPTRPEWPVPYALQADCLLRLGRVDEAAAAWVKAELALGGTVQELETFVCAIKREPVPYAWRAELLKKAAQQKDAQAAMDLVALDCAFPLDWWNVEANQSYLDHDVPAVLGALNLPKGDARRRAIECGKAIGEIKADDPDAVKQALTASVFLLDPGHTVPPHGGLTRVLLLKALRLKLVSDAELRQTFGPLLLKQARATGKDATWWELACTCGSKESDSDAQLKLEREAWKATADARFATAVLAIRQGTGNLAWGDAELAAAVKQFLENGPILREAVLQAEKAGKLTKDLLAQAVKAEFKHFSSTVARFSNANRPSAEYARQYFAAMSKMGADAAKKDPLPF